LTVPSAPVNSTGTTALVNRSICVFRDSSDGRSATGPDGRLNWSKLGLAWA
jgi:hypothetical protein